MKVARHSIHVNIYTTVFGVIGVILIAAGISTLFYSQNLASENISVSALHDYGPAPNLKGISGWINSAPLNITQLRGNVIIVDFWTYSCINCIRSIPHLNAWYNEYSGNGLVIIGISTPEFPFEHNYSNVYAAVKQFGIEYPVALDNNYSTWDAYSNEYWPADYVIDKNGDIRYESFGEGNYNTTESAIRALLENAGYSVPQNMTSVPLGVNFTGIQTPEIYLGWARERAPLGNKQGWLPNRTVNYSVTNISIGNAAYLSGEWYNAPDSMVAAGNDSRIYLEYHAKRVNVVAAPQGVNSTLVTVKLDGTNLTPSELGSDTKLVNGVATATVNAPRLYNLVSGSNYSTHLIEIDAPRGFSVYTFTFG